MKTKEFTARGRISWTFLIFSILFLYPVSKAFISHPENVEFKHVAISLIPFILSFLQILYAKTTILSVDKKQITYNKPFKKRSIPLQNITYVKHDLVITRDDDGSNVKEYFEFYDENHREVFKLNLSIFSKKEKRTLFLKALKKNKKDIIFDEKCKKMLQGVHEGIPAILKEAYMSIGFSEETADRLKNLHLIVGISLSVFFLWFFLSPLIKSFFL